AAGFRRGFGSASLRDLQVQLAFLRKDTAAMERQWTWAAGRAGTDEVITGRARVEASRGRFHNALRSVAGPSEDAGDFAIEAVLMRAEVGLSPNRSVSIAPHD